MHLAVEVIGQSAIVIEPAKISTANIADLKERIRLDVPLARKGRESGDGRLHPLDVGPHCARVTTLEGEQLVDSLCVETLEEHGNQEFTLRHGKSRLSDD